jgi:hypothetical protein
MAAYRQDYRDVNIDIPLSMFSVSYWQDTSLFVGTRYFPVVPVNHAAGTFLTYPRGYFSRPVNSKRAEDGVANTIGYKTGKGNYAVDDDAIRTFISDKKRANVANGQNLDFEASAVVTDCLLINKEIEFVNRFLTPGKWTKTLTGVASGTPTSDQFLKWSDPTSDPIDTILAQQVAFALDSGGRPWNKALMTFDVYNALSRHPAVLDRVRFGGTNERPAMITKQALAELLHVNEIEIMQSVINQAGDGIEDSDGNPASDMQFSASGKLMLNYVEDTVGNMKPVAAVGWHWNNFVGLGADNGPAVRTYPGVEGRRGNFVEAEFAIDVKMVSPDLGILFDEAV